MGWTVDWKESRSAFYLLECLLAWLLARSSRAGARVYSPTLTGNFFMPSSILADLCGGIEVDRGWLVMLSLAVLRRRRPEVQGVALLRWLARVKPLGDFRRRRNPGGSDFANVDVDFKRINWRCAWQDSNSNTTLTDWTKRGRHLQDTIMNSSSSTALQGCVTSLRTSMQLLESSINTLDTGVHDYPRLTKVLQTTRVSLSCPHPKTKQKHTETTTL